jgi:hypothetical protein
VTDDEIEIQHCISKYLNYANRHFAGSGHCCVRPAQRQHRS